MLTKPRFRQRRQDFRSESTYGFTFRKLEQTEPVDGPEWHKSMTLNLSAGGAAISPAHQKLSSGDLLEFELDIPYGPVFGIAQVVRLMDGEGECAVALNFVSIASSDKDKIARTVLTDGLENCYGKNK